MEITDATEALEHKLVTDRREHMDWDALHAELAKQHADSPQRARLAQVAIEQARAAVAQLQSLGHYFTLSENDHPAGTEYPKVMVHPVLGEMTVGSEREEDALVKDGWKAYNEAPQAPA